MKLENGLLHANVERGSSKWKVSFVKYLFDIINMPQFCNNCKGISPTESLDSIDHVITWYANISFITIFTGNLVYFVYLKKASEMFPIKDEFLASYSKQNFW